MTLHEVSSQLYKLSLGGFFNHEKFTQKQLDNMLSANMREARSNAIPNAFVMEIALPDGWWYCTINKCGAEYDYCIPDTREQEKCLLDRFKGAIEAKHT